MHFTHTLRPTTQRRLKQRDQQFAEVVQTWNTLRLNLDLEALFTALVEAAHRSLGFGVVLLNLVDADRQRVRVRSHAGLDTFGQAALAGAVYTWPDFAQVIDPRFQVERCFFIPAGAFDWTHSFAGPTYIAPLLNIDSAVVEPIAWHPDDALFVPIELRDGTIVGILSVDQPLDGLRPSPETLQVLEIFSAQAAVAIENAQLYARVQQELDERNAALQALAHAKESADRANRAKSTFLATMSHELRTPLTTIIGYSELLQRTVQRGDTVQGADLERIRSAGMHLLEIINNVLDLSKIEAGHVDLVPSTIVVELLVDEVIQTALPLITERANILDVHYAPDLGTICTDAMRLRQILLNVIANAAKFTEHGTITITVERARDDTGEQLVFHVSDTGIGMNAAQMARLFQPFTQVHHTPTHLIGGSGLGLALSQHLCQLLGGAITVVSIPGHGSTFTIRISVNATMSTDADIWLASDNNFMSI